MAVGPHDDHAISSDNSGSINAHGETPPVSRHARQRRLHDLDLKRFPTPANRARVELASRDEVIDQRAAADGADDDGGLRRGGAGRPFG